MPVYEYKALTDQGGPAQGVIDADTPQDARAKLRAMRLHPTQVTPVAAPARGGKGAPPGRAAKLPSLGDLLRPSRVRDLPLLTRQLATLLKAGIPLVDALTALIEQTDDPEAEKVFRMVRERIKSGASFAEALEDHPRVFGQLYASMVRAGEASGSLDAILKDLADFTRRQQSLRGKVSAAMAYPMVLAAVSVAVVAFLMGKVIPTLTGVLQAQGQELPFSTSLLIRTSEIFRSGWWAVGIAAAIAFLAFRTVIKSPEGRLAWDTHKMRIPLAGTVLKKQAVSRFATTLATLLKSGIPAVEAIRITRDIVDNALLAKTLDAVANKIVEGEDIATPLRRSEIFPPVVSYMIAIGEESGQLEEILQTISAAYEEEVDLAIQKFTSLLEPMMIVAMSVLVGFIVFSIVKPILQMSQLQ